MKFVLSWKPKALKELQRFPKNVAERIFTKMEWFVSLENPFTFAKRIINPRFGRWRFRTGDYRVICDVESRGRHTSFS